MNRIYSICLFTLLVGSCLPVSPNKEEIIDSSKVVFIDTTLKYQIVKVKGKEIRLYDNNYWRFVPEKPKKGKSKPKKQKEPVNEIQPLHSLQEPKNEQSVTNNIVSSPSPEPVKTKKYKSSSNNYQSSGYCGHPTKKGGSCRRRVKGGGYCWQHS